MEASQIRIDATLLETHKGQLVRLIGKVQSYDTSRAAGVVDSNGEVRIQIQDSNEYPSVGKIYEFIGKVSSNSLDVTVYSIVELSDNTNLDVAQKLVHYVHKVPELYY
ncbi:replication factor A protein 3 [Scheffersomyces coipomensis]|uniref:replication factor A protein 3 n=1 Tax=Scheffersomyces coipomensis TaxID=1788519 RepID=UPI00315D866E